MAEALISSSIFAKSDFFHSSFKLNFGIFVKEIQNTARENVNFQSILFLADLRYLKIILYTFKNQKGAQY
jgi:hypothetical protein